jgi:predicted nucleotidyltransferase
MNKIELKSKIVDSLKGQKEIERIIIFGSFNRSDSPNDIDIAVVQNSSDNYLTLALKYRKLIRNITKEIAVDIFPIVRKNENIFFKNKVETGEVIYARGN